VTKVLLRKVTGGLVISIILVFVVAKTVHCEGDPWYRDLDYHWAAPYIYVLWQEKVTDGYLYWWRDKLRAYFLPDSICTRAQFTVLLAKVFGLTPKTPEKPSYPDVPKSYRMLPKKPAWAWIEAAVSGGIAFTPRGHKFYPDSEITREDAVELLIRSLGLYEYAQSLSDKEVMELLRKFWDGMSTSPERRHSMACAIKLGIIEGYEDNTIRPQNPMWRCHAATIVYRSCLIRATAKPRSFSPDGDGIDETVTFYLTYLKNRGISTWKLIIENSSGDRIYTFNPEGRSGLPPSTLIWAGKDYRGHLVPAGRYYYQAWVKDRNGRQFFSVKKPLDVVKYSLSAYLYPENCRDNELLTLKAFTQPQANAVYGIFHDDRVRYFSPSNYKTQWTLQLVMGPFLPEGHQDVTVVAVFPRTQRYLQLEFTRLEDLWLVPDVSPNPAAPGQRINLLCETSTNVESVSANVFEIKIDLSKENGLWQASCEVPLDVQDGLYPVVFTAKTKSRTTSETVLLQVNSKNLRKIIFTLTR